MSPFNAWLVSVFSSVKQANRAHRTELVRDPWDAVTNELLSFFLRLCLSTGLGRQLICGCGTQFMERSTALTPGSVPSLPAPGVGEGDRRVPHTNTADGCI